MIGTVMYVKDALKQSNQNKVTKNAANPIAKSTGSRQPAKLPEFCANSTALPDNPPFTTDDPCHYESWKRHLLAPRHKFKVRGTSSNTKERNLIREAFHSGHLHSGYEQPPALPPKPNQQRSPNNQRQEQIVTDSSNSSFEWVPRDVGLPQHLPLVNYGLMVAADGAVRAQYEEVNRQYQLGQIGGVNAVRTSEARIEERNRTILDRLVPAIHWQFNNLHLAPSVWGKKRKDGGGGYQANGDCRQCRNYYG